MICSGAAPACELCGRVASVHSVHRGPINLMCPLLPHSSLQNSIIDQGNACQSARTKQSESRFLLWGQSLHSCSRLAEPAAQWFFMNPSGTVGGLVGCLLCVGEGSICHMMKHRINQWRCYGSLDLQIVPTLTSLGISEPVLLPMSIISINADSRHGKPYPSSPSFFIKR